MALIAQPIDFLGINYYTREIVAADSAAPFGLRLVERAGVPRTTMGWEVYPDGLRQVLVRVNREYGPPAIAVTECGAAFPDPGSGIGDVQRTAFLTGHLGAAAQAIEEGVPLIGFHAWSLLDNFEWERGFGQRFGLFGVDYATQQRTMRASGAWYRSLLVEHRRPR
jgi:beta-glucosidase